MASTVKHLRSSTANKRPVASGLADGQIAINTASGSPGVFFKDSNGALVKVGPAHVGSAAPNATPAGSAGNALGELWVDNSLTTPGLKYYTGSSFTNLTPSGTTSTVGLVELATSAETQTGTDADRAVTPLGLQSKISDSTSTTSSTSIASSTAVKSAYDLANAALPKSGGTVTGQILISPSGSLVFEGATDDAFETTIAAVNATVNDKTFYLPNITGTGITSADTGTVTSTMIADNTIVNADINTAAAIAYSKLSLSSGIVNTDISASAAIAHSKLANITAGQVLLGNASNVPTSTALTGDVTVTSGGVTAIAAGVIVDADVSGTAAISGGKINPNFGAQNVITTGTSTAASFIPTSSTAPTNGIYLSTTNTVALAASGVLRFSASNSAVTSTLPIVVPLGASGAPSYTFTGDTDTGIYSPAANTVAVSVAGVDALRATSNGSIFIKGAAAGGSSSTTQAINFNGGAPAQSLYVTSNGSTILGNANSIFTGNGQHQCQIVTTSANALSLWNGTANGQGPYLTFVKSRNTTYGSYTICNQDDILGDLLFVGDEGITYQAVGARIRVEADGVPSSTSMPGRLIFSTTSTGSTVETDRLTLDSSGNALIGVATANTLGGILQLKSGITFPAARIVSSDPNTLDDYEEGTWTPTIAGATTTGAGTYTTQVGRYTQIGNIITLHFNLTWTAHTGTGSMRLAGFPVTSANVTNLVPIALCYANNLTITGVLSCNVLPNNTYASLNAVNNGTGTALAMDTAATIAGTITYQTA